MIRRVLASVIALIACSAPAFSQETFSAYISALSAATAPLTGTEFFYVLQGTSKKIAPSSILSQTSATTLLPQLILQNTTSDTNAASLVLQKQHGGNSSLSGDLLGSLAIQGYVSPAQQAAAQIVAKQTAGASGNNIPTSWTIATSSTAGQNNQTLVFDSAGHVGIGAAAAAPTASGCTGFANAGGTLADAAGVITFNSAGSCGVAFGTNYASAPACIVAPGSSTSTVEVQPFTTGFKATFGTNQTAMAWHCIGN